MIYYFLKDKDQRVTLDILDAGGRVVRSFTSRPDSLTAADSVRADSVKRARSDSLKQAGVTDSVKIDSIVSDTLKDRDKPWPQRPPALPRVANKQGLNMFVWNLKYPDAVAFWGMVGVGTDGPVALPGVYQARLRVGAGTTRRGSRSESIPPPRARRRGCAGRSSSLSGRPAPATPPPAPGIPSGTGRRRPAPETAQ